MMTPRTQDEYLDLVDQAIFEIEDVLMCAGDEGDPDDSAFSDILPLYEKLSADLKQLHADILAGRQTIGRGEDLPFMPLVTKWKERIPFHDLLAAVNYTYKTGFPG
ncbi:MAG: hypothetical protein HY274_00760 [Gammaproteobacteria bacterium]|nr:hypothetical protein [Gammaproteobacteria bacterium]